MLPQNGWGGGIPVEASEHGVVTGGDAVTYSSGSRAAAQTQAAAQGTISEDFENLADGDDWGVAYTNNGRSDTMTYGVKADGGNKYFSVDGQKSMERSFVKSFADEIPATLSNATVSFDLYTTQLTADRSGACLGSSVYALMNNGTEVFSLYHNDVRLPGKSPTSSALFYAANGAEQSSSASVQSQSSYHVEIELDFDNHKVSFSLDGTEIETDIDIADDIYGINQFGLFAKGDHDKKKETFTWQVGIDNFEFSYTESTAAVVDSIFSLAQLPDVTVTQADYANYSHPAKVAATLALGGDPIEVEIKADTWTCTPPFDPNKKGYYIWEAEIDAPAEHPNNKGLKATYSMAYVVPSTGNHAYENDFTFPTEVWPSVAWGKEMDKTSGTGAFTLTQEKEADGNGYMKATVSGKGSRGSRLDLNPGIIRSADVTFDWMPMECHQYADGRIMFLSTEAWHPYFTLSYDNNFNIVAYTKNPLTEDPAAACTTSQKPFTGSIDADNPIVTGLSGKGKWFTVGLHFNYMAHTADLTITDKANPANTFTQTGIPIETEANGLKSMVINMNKKIEGGTEVKTAMGLDNIVVDYVKCELNDVVSVENPKDVSIAKSQFGEFEFPTEIKVKLGDGSEQIVPLGDWVAAPAFDPEMEGVYVWSAPLILYGWNNPFNLTATFTMTYTMLPFPTYVFNPHTLELNFGEALPELPTEVSALMSDGTVGEVKIDAWTPIREFNAGEEGIYVYGANVIPVAGEYQVVADQLTANENPDDPSAQRVDYTYNVYYRIGYFQPGNSYNAYQRSMESLDRGVYAVWTGSGVFVSWRLLVTEYGEDISFDVYRNGVKVNASPITDRTNFVDAQGKAGDVYVVAKRQGGLQYDSEAVTALGQNYMSIPLQKPDPQPTRNGDTAAYTINDAGVADVDGDGQYEIIVKWYPDNAFDSGKAVAPSSPTIFDIYEMDGTPLWRLNMGLEMPSGAHFNQFMLYDLDEDGKAELFIKTSDGTVSYKPNAAGRFDMTDESTIVSYIGDRSVTPGSNVNDNGHVSANTNEYVTVFNGQTGAVIDSINYINVTGNYDDWGKAGDGGNRSARYNIAIAYLPKTAGGTETIPAVLLNRGYYAKTTVAAYTLRDGKLNLEWNFSVPSGDDAAGRGNHNVSTGDMDQDGFDEICIGNMAVDHDGTLLWAKSGKEGQDLGSHGDTIHLSIMDPGKPTQLYVFSPTEEYEYATVNQALSNAGTGLRYDGIWTSFKDVGRAVAANITPTPGYEYWGQADNSGVYNMTTGVINTSRAGLPVNWRLYWDGDLLSELGDGADREACDFAVTKYDWETGDVNTVTVLAGKTNNSTKNNPSLTADLFGDWREEVMLRNEDDTELRIYMTTAETEYMIYTLMHDPVYRNAVANQNTSYNQPPHIGFYLGEDNRDQVLAMQLPTADIRYTMASREEGKPVGTEEPVNNGGDENESEEDDQNQQNAEPVYHTVVKGENLSKIAAKYGISLRQLLAWNPQIKNPSLIYPGQLVMVRYGAGVAGTVAIAGEGYYIIKKGDTLSKIAALHKIPLAALQSLNQELFKQKYIYPNQRVRLR